MNSHRFCLPYLNRNDPRLYKDDVDIRFSRTLNSCKLPQIRYASPERLFERLTDLRFLSIDFLNTFLLTYRVFTDGVTVLEALKKVHYNPEPLTSTSPVQDESTSTISGQHTLASGGSEFQSSSLPSGSTLCPSNVGGASIVDDLDFGDERRASTTSMSSDITNRNHRESVISTSSEAQIQVIQQLQAQVQQKNSQHWRLSHRKCKYNPLINY